MERPYTTFYLMSIVMFPLSVTVFDIFPNQLNAESLTLKMKVKISEVKMDLAIRLQMFNSILVIYFRILSGRQHRNTQKVTNTTYTHTHTRTHTHSHIHTHTLAHTHTHSHNTHILTYTHVTHSHTHTHTHTLAHSDRKGIEHSNKSNFTAGPCESRQICRSYPLSLRNLL